MQHWQKHIFLLTIAFNVFPQGISVAEEPNPVEVEFFEKNVRPALSQFCYECHGEETQESDLRLDSYEGMLTGGNSGPALVAGQPQQSLLITALHHNADALQMPPENKLPEATILAMTHWVKNGAHHPEMNKEFAQRSKSMDLSEARQFWAFQTPQKVETPKVANKPWCVNPIDYFVLAKLEQRGLKPVRPADKKTLIRRVTYDLTGLPPTVNEIEQFLADQSEDAYLKLVERLLASPRYGEKWGRHWLDVVRYADSNGLDENVALGNAWRYRDYVIQSLNEDKPIDQFITEQLAGDLLDANTEEQRHEQLIATGFLSLGPKVLAEGDETKMQMDIIDEQIDTIGKAFLGLTLGCARCHDHKFDPISTADYYALAGIFKSTKSMETYKRIAKWNENPIATTEELANKEKHDAFIAEKTEQLKELEQQLQPTVATTETEPAPQNDLELKEQIKVLKAELAELEKQKPELPTAMGVVDDTPVNVPIHVRGSHLTLGAEVPRNIPVLFQEGDSSPFAPKSSGRLELAQWLTSSEQPLTSRALVNRIWGWHFGEGLVSSTENFGILSEQPRNQELLDWLAVEFIERGWSLKEMHRLILLSNTYQMSSDHHADNFVIDSENQHQWRFSQQRLEAGSIRDGMLAVSGHLDLTMGGSLLHVGNREFIFNHTSKDETNYDSMRRSIYLPVIRNNLYDGFSLFDYTDASTPNGNRSTSTIAPQALYLLNSKLSTNAAEALAKLITHAHQSDSERLSCLYQRAYGRLPSSKEIEQTTLFLNSLEDEETDFGWTLVCQAILASNEFIYIR